MSQYSIYREFKNPRDAEAAVRDLVSAGLSQIQTEDLSHSLQSRGDAGDPPQKKSSRYKWSGWIAGTFFGFTLGLIVFAMPAKILKRLSDDIFLVSLGIIFCTLVGALFGLAAGFVLAKRRSLEPVSVVGPHAVGIRVLADSSETLMRAKNILDDHQTSK